MTIKNRSVDIGHRESVKSAQPGSQGARQKQRHAGFQWLAITVVAIVLCYMPIVFFEYGVADDYRLLAFFDRGFTNRTLMIAEGRPLQALWTNLLFAQFHTIGSLALLRFLNILCLAGVAAFYAWIWKQAGLQWRDAALASIATFTLPAYQAITSSAGMGVIPVAGLVAGIASYLVYRGTVNGAAFLRNACIGLICLVAALATYQPVAMFYWTVAAVLLFVPSMPRPLFLRVFVNQALIGFLALPIGFVIYRIGRGLHSDLAGSAREHIASNLLAKGQWFLQHPLINALNLWNISAVNVLAFVVAVALVCGLILHARRSGSGLVFTLGVAALLVPLSYLPNLMTAEDWATYRSQAALAPLLLVYLVITLRTQIQNRRLPVYRSVLPALAILGIATAAYNITFYCALPAARELTVVREHLRTLPSLPTSLDIKKADWEDTFTNVIRFDEFGIPQTSQPWTAVDLPYLVIREITPALQPGEIQIVLVDRDPESGAAFIDWGEILRKSEHFVPHGPGFYRTRWNP